MTRITGTLHIDQYTFIITFRSIRFRTRNVSQKKLQRKSKHSFHVGKKKISENRAVMWKNVVQPDRSYGACTLHTGYLSLQAHTNNM